MDFPSFVLKKEASLHLALYTERFVSLSPSGQSLSLQFVNISVFYWVAQ